MLRFYVCETFQDSPNTFEKYRIRFISNRSIEFEIYGSCRIEEVDFDKNALIKTLNVFLIT